MRASALVKHVSPAIVIPGEEELELEPEPEPQLLLIPEPNVTEGPNEKDLMESLHQENRALCAVCQPVMAFFCPWPGAPRRNSLGWVRWDMEMSVCILAVATVIPGGEYRH